MKHLLQIVFISLLTVALPAAHAHEGHTQYLHTHLFEYGLVAASAVALVYYLLVVQPKRAAKRADNHKKR